MEEKEAAWREQVNMIEQKVENMQEENKKERQKRYLISVALGIVITLLVFLVCYELFGLSFITFIVSGIGAIIGFWSSIVTLWDHFKKGRK